MILQSHKKKIEAYISKMPSLPTSVAKIMEICNNPSTSPADLNKVISLDPVLMGKVLKLINSAYYGLSQEITSLVRAIIMLGLNTVKNLALSTAVLGSLGNSKDFQALNMDGFWKHSLCVGVTAKHIAIKNGLDKSLAEEYFIAGLLHDIGKIPLNNILSEDYLAAISFSDREQSSLYLSEREVLQIDHAGSGMMIAENWGIGEEIKDAIAFHHDFLTYEGKYINLINSIAAANYFANKFGIGFSGDRYPETISDQILKSLNIGMEYFEKLEDQVTDEIDKARIFLRLAV